MLSTVDDHVPDKMSNAPYLPTALAREVMRSPPSVCPSIRLLTLYLRNRLTVDLELLLVSRS